jgi:hypothetical protein
LQKESLKFAGKPKSTKKRRALVVERVKNLKKMLS